MKPGPLSHNLIKISIGFTPKKGMHTKTNSIKYDLYGLGNIDVKKIMKERMP